MAARRRRVSTDPNLPLEVWKQTSANRAHFNVLYWSTVKFFTGLIVLSLGAAGASLLADIVPPAPRLLASFFLSLGGMLGLGAARSAKSHGDHVYFRDEAERIAERHLLTVLALDDDHQQLWSFARALDRPRGKDGSVRYLVTSGLNAAAWCLLTGAAILFLWTLLTPGLDLTPPQPR